MKILSLIGNLGSFLKWAGALAAAAVYSSPDTKFIPAALAAAIIGLILDKSVRVYTNGQLSELERAQSVEWSYLNVVRLKLEKGEAVDADLLERASAATLEVNDAYQRIYGFGRPATAIRSVQFAQ
jgi:hypothetical protein